MSGIGAKEISEACKNVLQKNQVVATVVSVNPGENGWKIELGGVPISMSNEVVMLLTMLFHFTESQRIPMSNLSGDVFYDTMITTTFLKTEGILQWLDKSPEQTGDRIEMGDTIKSSSHTNNHNGKRPQPSATHA